MQLNSIPNLSARPDYWSRHRGQPIVLGALRIAHCSFRRFRTA